MSLSRRPSARSGTIDEAGATFELARRPPSLRTAGLIAGMSGYRETRVALLCQHEAASLVVPLVFSFGTPFRVALGREPEAGDRQASFAAGLHAGPVSIQSDGRAECLQVDLSPLGAYCVLGGAVADMAARIVDLGGVLGAEGLRLRERLGAVACWDSRFDLAEAFVESRAAHRPSPEIAFAYRTLAGAGGNIRVGAVAEEVGWSRKHLVARFWAEVGLGPKAVARVMRFRRACRLARAGTDGWALIAAECGYADQAHLARDFAALAGEPPTAWARRAAQADRRLAQWTDDVEAG